MAISARLHPSAIKLLEASGNRNLVVWLSWWFIVQLKLKGTVTSGYPENSKVPILTYLNHPQLDTIDTWLDENFG